MATQITTEGKKRITFTAKAPAGSSVAVAGSFDGWADVKPMKETTKSGRYRAVVYLPKGEHQYKYVINGVWQCDVANYSFVPDGFGGLNSVLNVG